MGSARPRRFLIVNADDFGLGPGINAGIARAAAEGILTSVSLMANGPALDEALAMLPAWPHVSPGVHLALVGGRPVCRPEEVPSLVDHEGRFPAGYRELVRRFLRGGIRSADVYREWSAQARLLRERGVTLTHLDSHQHLHVLPGLLPAALRVAREAGIEAVRLPLEGRTARRSGVQAFRRSGGEGHAPTRTPEPPNARTPEDAKRPLEALFLRGAALLARGQIRRGGFWWPEHFVGFADSGRMTRAALARHLDQLSPGVTELMTHPGLEDPSARPYFPRPYLWEEEVAALTDPTIRERLDRLGIELSPYRRDFDLSPQPPPRHGEGER